MNPYLLMELKQVYKLAEPNDSYSTRDLITKLPHRLKVIVALEAAKMSFYVLEQYVFKSKKEQEVIKEAINIIEKWLDGKATENEVLKAANVTQGITAWNIPYNINDAISAISSTAFVIVNSNVIINTIHASHIAINCSFNAINYPFNTINYSKWLSEWWAKCYPLIEKELQDKYDLLCKQIIEDI